ncbi:hypothetical protein [Persicobacter psychrovividus]|uniref:Uncharacterized protein n=1 Tax=Persicobacter psychrovividus TaxID=387638 RepID=A0ABM7VBN9_9BACT|nr:hypothetical protein PEPS_04180 [Persicobacter psychrovividus]
MKLFAVYFGPAGVALVAHFQNLVELITQIPNEGINRALVHFWGNPTLEDGPRRRVFYAAIIYNLIVLFLGFGVFFGLKHIFLKEFIELNDLLQLPFEGLFFTIMSLLLLHLFLMAVILSHGHAKIYTTFSLVSLICSLILVAYFVQYNDQQLALLSVTFGQLLGLVCALVFSVRHRLVRKVKPIETSKGSMEAIWNFMLVTFGAFVFGKMLEYGVREWMINAYGLEQAGQWQSVVKISENYFLLFTGTVGLAFFPKVNQLILFPEELRIYVRGVIALVVPVTLIGSLFIFFGKEWLLVGLYSEDFLPASKFFLYQQTGDFFLIIAYLLAFMLSAQSKPIAHLSLQFGATVLYLVFIFYFCSRDGLLGVVEAHALKSAIYFAVLLFLNRRLVL